MKNIIVFFTCLLSITGVTLPMGPDYAEMAREQAREDAHSPQTKTRQLALIAHGYQDFLNKFGQKDVDANHIGNLMRELFDEDVVKKVNGSTVASGKDALYKQILNTKKDIKTWTVNQANNFIVDAEKNTVVAHFAIATEDKGTLVVMKYLKCVFPYVYRADGFIKEIDEVVNTKSNLSA